ncbi:hypothetical protein IUY40_14700, partial [Flavobacterium sp. ALJ2]|uniref:Calx-beta domain-containing protein n=1 Tax=Flavobacterium sp. ALJ2 TaxID=2786960 RepID=UPI00189E70C8
MKQKLLIYLFVLFFSSAGFAQNFFAKLNFSITKADIAEGESVYIDVSLPQGVTNNYAKTGYYTISGTAKNGVDYITLSDSLTIGKDSNSTRISITTLTDDLIELDETLILTGLDSESYYWGSNNVATITIKDATDPAKKVLSFSPVAVGVPEGGSAVIKVSLPKGITVTNAVDINYEISSSSTATNGTDYKMLSGIVTIPAGSGEASILVETILDKLIEPEETLIITGAPTAGYTWSPTANSAKLSIRDGTARGLRFSQTTEQIAEGTSTKITVSLPEGITAANAVEFNYTLSGTATNEDDYVLSGGLRLNDTVSGKAPNGLYATRLSNTGVLLPGRNSTDITIIALKDTVIEGDETVILTGAPSPGFVWSSTANSAKVTITDANPASDKMLRFSSDVSISEGSATTLKVSLPEGITAANDITFNYTVSGTAIAKTTNVGSVGDYEELSGTGTIKAGKNSADIVVQSLQDMLIELDETVIVTGGAITAGPLTGFTWDDAGKQATVTITDVTDPARRSLGFYYSGSPVREGNIARIEIGLTGGVRMGYPLTVNYTVSGGTATAGTDYKELTGSLTIPEGSYSGYIEVEALTDKVIEQNETIIVTAGENPPGFTWGNSRIHTVTIQDATDAANKKLRFSSPTASVKEGESTSVKVSLPEGFTVSIPQVVNYSIYGTATNGSDYTTLPTSVTIPAGSGEAEITVNALRDNVIELDETVQIRGGNLPGGLGIQWDTSMGGLMATATITDATDPAQKVLNFSKIKEDVAEGSLSDVQVRLPEGVRMGYPLTVKYTISGSATNGTDYTTLRGEATIPAGYGLETIYVAALKDNLIEPDETVILTGGDTEGFTWGSSNESTITIKDATDPAKKVLSMTPSSVSIKEGESTTIKISLPDGITVTSAVDINYEIVKSNIDAEATNGTDYTTLTGVATIPAGSGTAEIIVDALLDKVIEYDEGFRLIGAPTAGFTWKYGTNSALIFIKDATDPANKRLNFSSPTPNVKEGESTTIQIGFPEGFTAANEIRFSFKVGGTATIDNDYTLSDRIGVIPAGKNFVAIVIDAKTDTVIELDETVTLSRSDGNPITVLPGIGWNDAAKSATVTITDANDPAQRVLNFSKIKEDVAEGLGSAVYISLPEGVSMGYPLTVNYRISGSATNGTDYSTLTGTETIPAGFGSGVIYVAALKDNLVEPDETVILTGGDTEGFTWGSSNESTITIKDDIAKRVLNMSPSVSIKEGESTIIKISLREGITVTSAVDINYSISGSATAGTDYTALTGVATILAGSGTAEIKVD